MPFEDIKGQDRAVSFLRASVDSMRTGHAYIFYGPEGTGKALAAIEFAKAVNCLATEPSGRPCDACTSCRKIDSSNHPDVFVVRPAEDARSVGIDDIRGVIKDIALKPYEARKKFYVIDPASGMKEAASNALLKTLEEPPSDSVVVMIAESLGSILPTIVSRSAAVKFFPLRARDIEDVLAARYGTDPAKAGVISRLAAGSLGKAVRYCEGSVFEKRGRVISALADGTFLGADNEKLTRQELRNAMDIALTWYRDILVAKASGEEGAGIINIDRRADIYREAARLGYENIQKAIAAIMATISHVDDNANPKLAFAALAVELG